MKVESKTHANAHKIGSNSRGHWVKDSIGVLYVVDDKVQFAEDFEHLANGFCRLLEISEEKAIELVEEWVEIALKKHSKLPSELSTDVRLDCLKEAVLKVLPVQGERFTELGDPKTWGTDIFGNQADTIHAGSISGNLSRAVVGCKSSGFAWLISPSEKKPVHALSIEYDTAYFDDRPDRHYGMKQYLKQTDWRMQKARRFAAHVLDVAGDRATKWLDKPADYSLLDVGSAIGLFRAAFSEFGFSHYGIDVSKDAIELCKSEFNFETWFGSIFDVGQHAKPDQKFNVITLWDVVEHLDRHKEALKSLSQFLTDDGILVIRTPNLEAMEAKVLGDWYYSYKLDHTSYFSVKSLNAMFKEMGLEPLHIETTSHIFRGFTGVQPVYDASKRLEGADILAVYKRAGSKS